MKNIKNLLGTCLIIGLPVGANKHFMQPKSFPVQNETAFAVGEELNYRIHYGIIDAGEATLKVEKIVNVAGKSTFYMNGTGRSVGMAEWFFPTRDVYKTYMDTQALVPLKFVRDVNEGGFIIKRNIQFNRSNNTARDSELKKDTVFTLPKDVQDIFSAFYFARNLNVSGIAYGDVIEIPVFLDHEIFPFKIKFIGTELVKTKFGKINCLKFVPVVQKGRVFQDEDDMHLWISADANHVPVRIKSELVVGAIKIDLAGYKGLKYPITFY